MLTENLIHCKCYCNYMKLFTGTVIECQRICQLTTCNCLAPRSPQVFDVQDSSVSLKFSGEVCEGIIRLLTHPLFHKTQSFYGRIFQGHFSGDFLLLPLFLGSLNFSVWETFFQKEVVWFGVCFVLFLFLGLLFFFPNRKLSIQVTIHIKIIKIMKQATSIS